MCGAMSLGHGWMGYGLGSIVVWGIFLAVVAALVYVLLRAGRGHGRAAVAEGTPLEILSRRYARGEINLDQLDEMRRALEERRTS